MDVVIAMNHTGWEEPKAVVVATNHRSAQGYSGCYEPHWRKVLEQPKDVVVAMNLRSAQGCSGCYEPHLEQTNNAVAAMNHTGKIVSHTCTVLYNDNSPQGKQQVSAMTSLFTGFTLRPQARLHTIQGWGTFLSPLTSGK